MTTGNNLYGQPPEEGKMKSPEWTQVDTPAPRDFAWTATPQDEGHKAWKEGQSLGCELITPWNNRQPLRSNRRAPRRLNLDQEKTKNGLAQLVLTVIKLLHELLEKQALRRIDGGSLTDEEIERLGFTLMRQSEEIRRISREFGLEDDDLNLDLGPLGKLL